MKRVHFNHFDIAGFTYWDGALVFSELKIGTLLNLKREKDNPYDPHAVAIYYNDHKIGFIPKTENRLFAKFMDQGYDQIFEVAVNRLSPEEHTENQVGVVVFLLEQKNKR